MLPQLVHHPSDGLYILFALTFSIDEDVIEIHYHENVELLGQEFVDITLKCDRCVGQSKRHDLILEIAIAGPEGRFSFIAFPDPYSIIGIGQIELGEMSNPI